MMIPTLSIASTVQYVAPDSVAVDRLATARHALDAARVQLREMTGSAEQIESLLGEAYAGLALGLGWLPDPAVDPRNDLPLGPRTEVAELEAGSCAANVVVYDSYFHITRHRELDSPDALAGMVPTILRLLTDLASAPISIDDRANLLAFIVRCLTDMLPEGSDPVALPTSRPRFAPTASTPLQRWIVGHHLYGLANRSAAKHIIAAGTMLTSSDMDGSAAALTAAAEDITALTAAMNYAAAMTSFAYRKHVRPTMAPPSLPFELTGSMNLDHRAYRAALELLLTQLGGPVQRELRARCPRFAGEYDRVLHLDLADLEHHITLTFRLVGAAAALDEHDHASAVRQLRELLTYRLDRYRKIMRSA